MAFMFSNICCLAVQYTSQKLLLQRSLEDGNPISPNEWTYWITLILLVLDLLAMVYLKADFFPLPKEVRATYILRCIVGMMCNLTFLFSLQFIPFAKASVIFWTMPVFTALFAFLYLGEKLSPYDWAAVFIAFIGLLLI
jgi:drug/metabolite transporter (DMT)-like permease